MGRIAQQNRTPDEIAKAIREEILRGELEPGMSARQDDIAQRFSVSRVPVREALRSLVAEGLMTCEPQKGFRVARLEPGEAREILEIRSILEVQALRWAIQHITAEAVAHATAALDQSEKTQSIDEWSEMNGRFHAAILTPCGRPQLLALINQLNNRVDRYIRLLVALGDYRSRAQREHRAILAAVDICNVEAAAILLKQHIEDTAVRLDDFLAQQRK